MSCQASQQSWHLCHATGFYGTSGEYLSPVPAMRLLGKPDLRSADEFSTLKAFKHLQTHGCDWLCLKILGMHPYAPPKMAVLLGKMRINHWAIGWNGAPWGTQTTHLQSALGSGEWPGVKHLGAPPGLHRDSWHSPVA